MVGLLVADAGHGFPDTRRSDHSPFWDAGYPALMMTDTANFRNPAYHQSGDTLETLDLSYTVKVTKAVVAYLADLGIKGGQ
ncbi:MAG TPA: M28 family peptidase [Nitrospiria bacterium]